MTSKELKIEIKVWKEISEGLICEHQQKVRNEIIIKIMDLSQQLKQLTKRRE